MTSFQFLLAQVQHFVRDVHKAYSWWNFLPANLFQDISEFRGSLLIQQYFVLLVLLGCLGLSLCVYSDMRNANG